MAKADINGDGREDLYVGGSPGFPGELYIQQTNGSFIRQSEPAFEASAASEDACAIFFDANRDGKPDLFIASGGYHSFTPEDAALQSRLYLNDGSGKFTRSINAIPQLFTSSCAVAAGDINGDGFLDLFLGGRVIPGRYPETPSSYVLINDGKGVFHDATKEICPALGSAGMFTSAVFADLDGDKKEELITAGEWLPVQVWKSQNGKLVDKTVELLGGMSKGWWNTLAVKDVNGDGHPDIIAGNYGLNSQWKASEKEPVEMIYKDFDDNGSVDPIFCYYIQGKSYPYVGRDELLDQMSTMRTRFTDYKSYADAGISEIFTPEELNGVKKLSANTMETKVWVSNKNGKFVERDLPVEAQFSPVYAVSVDDFDGDGKMDLLLGGNVRYARVKIGLNESSEGQLFLGDGKGSFRYVTQPRSGLKIKGEVRSFCTLGNFLFAGVNGQALQTYQFKKNLIARNEKKLQANPIRKKVS